jgi:hypothetical protein
VHNSFFFLTFAAHMDNRVFTFFFVALLLTACGNKREAQQKAVRQQIHTQYYEEQLAKAQAELARTDSLLQVCEASLDSLDVNQRIRLDSLQRAVDVLGAKVRYIHKKQKDLP